MTDLDFGPKPGIDSAPDQGLPIRSPLSDPTVTPDGVRDEDIERSLRPKSLHEFVGQKHVRDQLRVFIDAAKQRSEPLDHALFAGPPGLGKCVAPDTLLLTPQGMIPIGTLGDMEGESWQPITRPLAGLYGTRTADWFYNNGDGPTLRITTSSGYQLEGTPNHPLLVLASTADGVERLEFRRMAELTSGDRVAIRLGAGMFGSATHLHVEGIDAPTLQDPAVVPSELTPDVSHLLGILFACGRISPGGDGFVFTAADLHVADEARELIAEVFCVELESFGAGPLGARYGARSPRIAAWLTSLGMTREGMTHIPDCVYRAPRLQVAEFLRGLFAGTELAPTHTTKSRTVVGHLQQILANFGIESQITPGSAGWTISVNTEPSQYDSVTAPRDIHGAPEGGDHHPPLNESPKETSLGFGITPAGILVAMPDRPSDSPTYRRGRAHSDEITPVAVEHHEGRLRVAQGPPISVAEVEPLERGRALLRERVLAHDVRALAVRTVRSELKPDQAVELVWEPIVAIEPGHAHTVDVSVPDGHTFVGNGIICHNTTLASVVATEMGSTMHQTSGPALEKKADVAAILTALGPGDVLFIDEIHRMNTSIEEVLYSAMEDYQIDIVLGQGPAARTMRLELAPFTLVGATTRTGLLTTPLRDRFGMIQRLEYYAVDELQDVVIRSAGLLKIPIHPTAAHEIASRSRGTPRIANRLLRRVRDVADVRYDGDITEDIAREALELVDIDPVGLDRIDRAILEAILCKFGGGPVGLSTLSVSIGEEAHTLEDVYEPYLLQRGFIQRTPRGRIITSLGTSHLALSGVTAPEGGGSTVSGPTLFDR